MSYTQHNFKTKKELKAALTSGQTVYCYQHGLGPDLSNHTGEVFLEGPHYPQPHKWYATGHMIGGKLVSIK